jgi:hypothetical protein
MKIGLKRDRNEDVQPPKMLLFLVSKLLSRSRAHHLPREVVMNSFSGSLSTSSGNPTAQVFRNLFSTWQQDAASPKIDALAAELTAQIAKDGSVCVGLMQVSSIPKLFGLIYFLDGYGLLLRQRYRDQRDGIFVYVDRKSEVISEFAGSVVKERVPVQEQASWMEFARAA